MQHLVGRDTWNDRLDRIHWPSNEEMQSKDFLKNKFDAHLLRPGYEKLNWGSLHLLGKCILKDNGLAKSIIENFEDLSSLYHSSFLRFQLKSYTAHF